MWSDRVRQNKIKNRQYGSRERRLRCTKCGAVMKDREPMMQDGEFWHPDNDCTNSGKCFDWELVPRVTTTKDGKKHLWSSKGRHVSGITHFVDKGPTRARNRGAKLAAKHRPK